MKKLTVEEKYMKAAIREAKKALKCDEVPIGAVIVKDNKVIAKAHNMVEKTQDATCHAEIMAIMKKSISTYFLYPCIIPLIPGGTLAYAMFGIIWNNQTLLGENGIKCSKDADKPEWHKCSAADAQHDHQHNCP